MSRPLPGSSKGRTLEVEITDTKQQGQTRMVSACSGGPDTSQNPGPSTRAGGQQMQLGRWAEQALIIQQICTGHLFYVWWCVCFTCQVELVVKNLPAKAGDRHRFDPWVRKSSWRRAWQFTSGSEFLPFWKEVRIFWFSFFVQIQDINEGF